MSRHSWSRTAVGCFFSWAPPFGLTWTSGLPPTVGGGPAWASAAVEYSTATNANISLMALTLVCPKRLLGEGPRLGATHLDGLKPLAPICQVPTGAKRTEVADFRRLQGPIRLLYGEHPAYLRSFAGVS